MKKTLKKFYSLHQTDSQSRECASAFLSHSSISNVNDFDFETQIKEHYDRVSLKFHLVKLTIESDGISVTDDLSGVEQLWMDWIPNQFVWPMFSEKLKSLIVDSLLPHQKTHWIKCEVTHKEECRFYYIPVYEFVDDVLDLEKTEFVDDTDLILDPVFKQDVIDKLDFFYIPFKYGFELDLYVSDKVKSMLVKNRISGVSFDQL
jgi:hypothetical protein